MTLRFDAAVINLQLFLVLRIAVPQHADGGDTQPQQITVALGGVPLEITVKFSFALRHRQLIVRSCEMIHADKLITRFGQGGYGVLQDIQFLLRARQICVFDFALGSKQVRHMGIVKYAQAIGA
ncbi:hypothetical protein D3C72_1538910 [compost metagenome]